MLHARRRLRPGADDVARPGRLVGRRQDRDQPPAGKNLIGAFYQPLGVVADVDALKTLPKRELVAGLAEVIKYGAIATILPRLDRVAPAGAPRWRPGGAGAGGDALCRIKAAVVAADERESGPRAILNFGHTFAHAIETGTGHGRWLHGEAVGCGMAMGADLSVRLGLIAPSHAARITALIGAAGLPLRAPELGIERYLELMRMDKKAAAGALRFVVLEGAGRAGVRTVDPEAAAATVAAFTGGNSLAAAS